MNWIKKIKCIIGLCPEPDWERDFPEERIKEILLSNPAIGGSSGIALEIFQRGNLACFKYGEKIIEQGTQDDDVYFFLSGQAHVIAQKEKRALRSAPYQVGEIVALNPAKSRSATVQVCSDHLVAWKISGQDFRAIKGKYPEFLSRLTVEMNTRLVEQHGASRIAKENNSAKWFFISITTSIVTSTLTWFLLQKTDWTLDANLIISGGVFISSFLFMMLNNPAFFWKRASGIILCLLIANASLNQYIALDYGGSLETLHVYYDLNTENTHWLTALGDTFPLLIALIITGIFDFFQQRK